jgi:hypothetical protein
MCVLNIPKQGEPLSPFFQLCLVDAIRMVQENHGRLESNGANQLIVYADDVNLLDENINTIKTQRSTASN